MRVPSACVVRARDGLTAWAGCSSSPPTQPRLGSVGARRASMSSGTATQTSSRPIRPLPAAAGSSPRCAGTHKHTHACPTQRQQQHMGPPLQPAPHLKSASTLSVCHPATTSSRTLLQQRVHACALLVLTAAAGPATRVLNVGEPAQGRTCSADHMLWAAGWRGTPTGFGSAGRRPLGNGSGSGCSPLAAPR